MKTFVLATSALALSVGFASAQDAQLPQAQTGSQWYSDAQTVLQQMLDRQPNTNRAKNIILMVSDGNGVGTNYATRIFAGQEAGGLGEEHVLSHETFPHWRW